MSRFSRLGIAFGAVSVPGLGNDLCAEGDTRLMLFQEGVTT